MNILLLEDDPHRVREYRARFAELDQTIEMVHVETASECIELLATRTFDLILFDHDLGGQVYVSVESPETGSEVARWLTAHPENENHKARIMIHSLNRWGVAEMRAHLRNAEAVEYLWEAYHFHLTIGSELKVAIDKHN